uniref:Uncharacterized protein n=1 Tax=Aegilops tauschii subsp. strangulata TaxID=200361 RepID=A0A453N4M9_AEGTS
RKNICKLEIFFSCSSPLAWWPDRLSLPLSSSSDSPPPPFPTRITAEPSRAGLTPTPAAPPHKHHHGRSKLADIT